MRRIAFAQQVAGKGEEWNRQQDRHLRQTVDLDRDDLEVDLLGLETEQRGRHDDRKEGGSK